MFISIESIIMKGQVFSQVLLPVEFYWYGVTWKSYRTVLHEVLYGY